MTKTLLFDDPKYGLQSPDLVKIASYAAGNAAFKSQLQAHSAVNSAQHALKLLNKLSQVAPVEFDAARAKYLHEHHFSETPEEMLRLPLTDSPGRHSYEEGYLVLNPESGVVDMRALMELHRPEHLGLHHNETYHHHVKSTVHHETGKPEPPSLPTKASERTLQLLHVVACHRGPRVNVFMGIDLTESGTKGLVTLASMRAANSASQSAHLQSQYVAHRAVEVSRVLEDALKHIAKLNPEETVRADVSHRYVAGPAHVHPDSELHRPPLGLSSGSGGKSVIIFDGESAHYWPCRPSMDEAPATTLMAPSNRAGRGRQSMFSHQVPPVSGDTQEFQSAFNFLGTLYRNGAFWRNEAARQSVGHSAADAQNMRAEASRESYMQALCSELLDFDLSPDMAGNSEDASSLTPTARNIVYNQDGSPQGHRASLGKPSLFGTVTGSQFGHIIESEYLCDAKELHPVRHNARKTQTYSEPLRKISRSPAKVLDAPNLQDDFYLNLVDWGACNLLAVGLAKTVFLWCPTTGAVTQLCDVPEDDLVASVAWNQEGNTVAVGTGKGEVQIWDPVKCEKICDTAGHSGRVGALAWNGSRLATGGRDHSILLRDTRSPGHNVDKLIGHRQEVCGLSWSFNGSMLASGGNDNKVLTWSSSMMPSGSAADDESGRVSPVLRLADHQAAVKALAWSPHQHHTLATGGGTADRCIRFWDTHTGTCLNCVDTGSQVCNLRWAKSVNEVVSTHGYSLNQVVVWKYPSMRKVVTLTGHTLRVLYLSASPDGQTVVTGAGDETLRFWNIFPPIQGDLRKFHNGTPTRQIRITVVDLGRSRTSTSLLIDFIWHDCPLDLSYPQLGHLRMGCGASSVNKSEVADPGSQGAGRVKPTLSSAGSVQKATNRSTGAVRAVKTVLKRTVKSLQALSDEIEVMRMLDHPNIIKLYETFEDLRNVYLVMEMCTGGELFDRIVEVGNFSERVAAGLVRQMLSAIYYMHSKGVVHRDLKPENFMLANPKDVTEAPLKIIDFGLSKRLAPGQVLHTKACTPYYVAPEVLAGSYTNTCDMWSIGVITYILLCGSPPFYGKTEADIIRRVREGSFEFDLPPWKTVTDDAKDLIKRLLVLDPSQRLTADQALHHRWIESLAPDARAQAISPTALVNLNTFNEQSKLKRMALTIIAQQIPEDTIDELKRMFHALDENDDGTLTVEEITSGFSLAGMDVPADFDKYVSNIDMGGSGAVDYSKFLAATLDTRHYIEEGVCWAAFRAFDLDGNGRITREELSQVDGGQHRTLLSMVLSGGAVVDNVKESLGIHSEEIDTILREVDKNGDGEIDFDEFMQMMRLRGGRSAPQAS
ncbi:substrate-specific activator of APC-dependent proteolysis [Perkinsus chesapeaki]|uniref:non-specific serine/threonine protein kinase n=1 Tax=Perkinsus chesapeaki TaxID=330153 RepID=A0A7J6MM13_PERCH|nr:substrate-specific activator of APC-dependent proteolysis [Perkinsus chesapeaki]